MSDLGGIGRKVILSASLGLLAACSVLPPEQAVDVYRLPSYFPGETEQSRAPALLTDRATSPQEMLVLQVASLDSSAALDSARIAVLPEGDLLTSYRGVRWSDPAPELMRNRLVRAFTGHSPIVALKNIDAGVPVELKLGGALEAFQAEYRDGKPVVRVQFDATLVDVPNRRVIAVHRFEVVNVPPSPDIPSVVKAFGQATDELSTEVVNWAKRATEPT